jgi:hypothetical protein
MLTLLFLYILMVIIKNSQAYIPTEATTKKQTTTKTPTTTSKTITTTTFCASEGQECGLVGCCQDLVCIPGCQGVRVCCKPGYTAYCSDPIHGVRKSYCATTTTTNTGTLCYCYDTQGDRYKCGDCVTTTNINYCSIGWVRCTAYGWSCDFTCTGSSGDSGGNVIPSCYETGLQTPLISPSTPIEGRTFNIECPVNKPGYDCITAYANQDNNSCTFSSWNNNNAVFNCGPLTQGTYTAVCKVIGNTSSKCCPTSSSKTYNVIKLPLSLTLFLNSTVQRTDNQTITARVTSNGTTVSGALVYFNISSPVEQKTLLNCTTDNQGLCYVTYQIPTNINIQTEKGTWIVIANATKTNYKVAYAQSSFQLVECRNNNGCFCFEYCSSGRCVDFRNNMKGCQYYDGCLSLNQIDFYPGTRIINRESCCSNGNCNENYCVNVDKDICQDQNYICHGWFIECGV